jgi:hypothetical protein
MRFLRPSVSLLTILRMFAPATVARADEPGQTTPTPTPTAAVAVAPSFDSQARPTVFVHIDAADRGVELEGRLQLDGPWVTSFSCKAPCDTALPRNARYQLMATDQRSSSEFLLAGSPGQRVTMKVVPASKDAATGGAALIVVGSLVMVVAPVLAVVGLFANSSACSDTGPGVTCTNPAVKYEAVALASLLGGGAMLVGGILIRNYGGRLRQKQTVSPFLPPMTPERPDTTWLRAPMWRDSVKDGIASSPRLGTPIFSGRF